jgi:hypothetical protein
MLQFVVITLHRPMFTSDGAREELHGPFDDEEAARSFAHWYTWGHEHLRRSHVAEVEPPPDNRDEWPTVDKPPPSDPARENWTDLDDVPPW